MTAQTDRLNTAGVAATWRLLRWPSSFFHQVDDLVARHPKRQARYIERRTRGLPGAQHEDLVITPPSAHSAVTPSSIEEGG